MEEYFVDAYKIKTQISIKLRAVQTVCYYRSGSMTSEFCNCLCHPESSSSRFYYTLAIQV